MTAHQGARHRRTWNVSSAGSEVEAVDTVLRACSAPSGGAFQRPSCLRSD